MRHQVMIASACAGLLFGLAGMSAYAADQDGSSDADDGPSVQFTRTSNDRADLPRGLTMVPWKRVGDTGNNAGQSNGSKRANGDENRQNQGGAARNN